MYRFLTSLIVSLAFMAFIANAEEINIDLSPGYANDVWWDLHKGIVKVEPKDNWDIAFEVYEQNAGVRINGQKGVNIWVVPDSDFETWNEQIDTSGIANWETAHNSESSWSVGAFNLGKNGFITGGDFGWGGYNMSTHSISGDKVFVISVPNLGYKKIMIESLLHGTYTVWWADLNGENEIMLEISKKDYLNRLFAYVDLATATIIDREPDINDWTLLFGKYIGMVETMDGAKVPYPLTGVRTNPNYVVARVEGVPALDAKAPTLNEINYTSNITEIGSDWKKLNTSNFTYEIPEDLSFFVTENMGGVDPQIDKIIFKSFEGGSSGKLSFTLNETISSVNESFAGEQITLYPSVLRANEVLNIQISDFEKNSNEGIDILIYNYDGSLVNSFEGLTSSNGLYSVALSNISSGLYLVKVISGRLTYNSKIVVE